MIIDYRQENAVNQEYDSGLLLKQTEGAVLHYITDVNAHVSINLNKQMAIFRQNKLECCQTLVRRV